MAAEVCGKGGWTAAGVSTERRCCGRGEVGVGGGGSACLGWSSGEHLGWVHTCPGRSYLALGVRLGQDFGVHSLSGAPAVPLEPFGAMHP